MPVVDFVTSLQQSGRVCVGPVEVEAPPTADELLRAIDALDTEARLEAAGEPPELDAAAAAWAVDMLYRACQFLVYRHLGAEAVRAALSQPCPAPPSPRACYSVDLALQYLPDLWSLSHGVAADDPLTEALMNLARQWPLSSVGMKGVTGCDVGAFIAHPSLRRLYVDRIIERGDLSRLEDPRVADAVGGALGLYPGLAPSVAAALSTG